MIEEVARRLARSRSLVDLGRWEDAAAEASLALAAEPTSVEALCLLAQSQLNLGRAAEACATAEAALRLAPAAEWPHRIHSVALGSLGRHPEAVAAARRAVRLAPHVADTHQRLANALVRMPGCAAEAWAEADRAVALDPHSASAYVAVGLAAGTQGCRRQEREAYLRALELDPTHATALNNLAAIDVERGRLGRAVRSLVAALRSDPQHPQALANLDLVGVRVLWRLTGVMVAGSLLVTLLAYGEEGRGPAPWVVRAVAGAAVVGVGAAVAWGTLRHLPPGARRHLTGLPRRLAGVNRLVGMVFAAVVASMLAVALLPAGAAARASVAVLTVLRLAWLAALVGLARTVRRNIALHGDRRRNAWAER